MANQDWKKNLIDHVNGEAEQQTKKIEQDKLDQEEVVTFFQNIVKPAFDELSEEFKKHHKQVETHVGDSSAHIVISSDSREELNYYIKVRGRHPYSEEIFRSEGQRYRGEGSLRSGAQDFGVSDFTVEEICSIIVDAYTRRQR